MDRARRNTSNRRKAFGASTSPQSNSISSFDHQSSASPVMAHANNTTPQTAPQGRRANKSLQPAFTFSTPGPNKSLNLRKRSKTFDDYATMADEEFENGSPKKGGHSLRKRARVDYTFEQIDDDLASPGSTTAASLRSKKRRSEHSYDTEDLYGPGAKGRGASMDADTPSSRRRNPARKTSEVSAYRDDMDDDENDVQDTIEVGVSYSEDSDKSDAHLMDQSNASSDQSTEDPQKLTPSQSKLESFNTDLTTEDLSAPNFGNGPNSPSQKMPVAESATDSAAATTAIAKDTAAAEAAPPQSFSEPDIRVQDGISSKEPQERALDTPEPKLDIKDTVIEDQVAQIVPPSSPPPVTPTEKLETIDAPTTEDVTGELQEEPSSQLLTEHHSQKQAESSQDDTKQVQTPEPTAASSTAEPAPVEPVANGDAKSRDEPSQDEGIIATKSEPTPLNGNLESPQPVEPKDKPLNTLEASHAETAEAASDESISVFPDNNTEPPVALSTMKAPTETKSQTVTVVSHPGPFKPQPRPKGRWAYLTPYIDNEYVLYPEKKTQAEDEAGASEDQTPEDRDNNDMEPMVDDNDEIPENGGIEAPTPALNTPIRGSPAPDSSDPTTANSPAAGGDDAYEVDVSEPQEAEQARCFRYRKLRDPEDFVAALENYEEMSTTDLYELLEAVNVSLVQWQDEWNSAGKVVDDYENALRRRAADQKYEARTRNLHQHGANFEEPDFAVKGYKSRDKEFMNETRYLQSQDRVMAAAYGFEHDPHPSKIGRQNPETQQVGIMTRGRSLRNQPKPTAKATEADEVTGKRQRKPVQLFDPVAQDISRSSTPVPARGRRRRTMNTENDDNPPTFASSFNSEAASDGEGNEVFRIRRKRGPRPKVAVPSIVEELAPTPPAEELSVRDTPRSSRKSRNKQPIKYDESYPFQFVEDEPEPEPKQPKRRHILTLKIPKGKNFSEPSSAITDNGDSRPSTASSDSTSHTAESSYSFRPKRQKRFRDDPEEAEDVNQAPVKKRKRNPLLPPPAEEAVAPLEPLPYEGAQGINRKVQKIKVVRATPASRKGTPSSVPNGEEADEAPKDYKSMTKSEKMSASMKSRWANGNMAGAVEKRKATLAAKKAAQAAAEQRIGLIAPKPKTAKTAKKESAEQGQPTAPVFPQHTIPGVGFPFPASN